MLSESVKLKLLHGDDIKFDEKITIKSYKLSYIMDEENGIGYDKYNSYLYHMIYTPFEKKVNLFQAGILFTKITHWEIFISFFRNDKKDVIYDLFKCLLDFDITGYNAYKLQSGDIIITNENRDYEINEEKFKKIVYILREINGFSNKKEDVIGNDTTANYIVEREIRRIKKKRNLGYVTLETIIASVSSKSNNISIFNIWELTLYQIYRQLDRLKKDDDYNLLMTALYSGSVRKESVNINKEIWYSK